MRTKDGVSKTIASIIDEDDSDLSLEQRFDRLGQEIIANAFFLLMRAKRTGTKVSTEEENAQIETIKQFKIITSIYTTLKRTNRIIDKPNEHFDEQLIKKIKAQKSTMGEIVVSVPQD